MNRHRTVQRDDGLWITTDRARAVGGGGLDFESEILVHSVAAQHGLAVPIVERGDDWYITEPGGMHIDLWNWHYRDNEEGRMWMRDQVIAMFERLYELGVHHRDGHWINVLVNDDNRPRLIDFEWAIVDHNAPCSYDLYGPDVSGVPVPSAHIEDNVAIWWEGSFGPLAHLFGPIPSC